MSTIGGEQFSYQQKKLDLVISLLGDIQKDLECIISSSFKSPSERKKKSTQYEKRIQESRVEDVKETEETKVRAIENIQSRSEKKSKSKLSAKRSVLKHDSATKSKSKKPHLKKTSSKVEGDVKSAHNSMKNFGKFSIYLKQEETKRFQREKKVKCDDGG